MWTHAAEKVPYKTVQDTLLENCLPLGSSVWVNYRNIAAGQSSSLKYQATIVFKNVEGSDDRIPKEYIDKFKPFEIRVALVRINTISDLGILNIVRSGGGAGQELGRVQESDEAAQAPDQQRPGPRACGQSQMLI